jgi:TM2 domain-containing membrane protein YozV
MPPRLEYLKPEPGPTEIRIHGVGGTGPDVLLNDPHPVQVSGDDRAGFFRRAGGNKNQSDPRERALNVEAYSWGGLTSRKASRAIWILLLPFTLTNVAGWMVVRFESAKRLARMQERLCRITALLATLLLVVGVGAIGADVIGVQCGRFPACRGGHWWLAPLGAQYFEEAPLRRLVAGLLPAVLLLVWLIWLGRKSRKEYEEFPPKRVAYRGEADEDARLDSENFWFRATFVRRLTALHIAGALSYLAYLLATTADELYSDQTGSADIPGWIVVARWASGLALAVAIVWILLLRSGWQPSENQRSFVRKQIQVLYAALTTALFGLVVAGSLRITLDYPAAGLQTFRRAPLYLLLFAIAVAVVMSVLQMLAWLKNLRAERKQGIDRRGETVWGASPKFWLFAALFGGVGLVIASVAMSRWEGQVLCAILGAQLLAAIFLVRARVPSVLAGIGLVAGIVALFIDEPPALHIVTVASVLSVLLIIYDWKWPRTEFRWGAPPIMGLLGVMLLVAVISGASTRIADYLDKEQSPGELKAGVIRVLERNEEEGALSQDELDSARGVVNDLFEEGTPNAEELVSSLESDISEEVGGRLYAFAVQGDRRPIDIKLPNAYKWITVGITGSLFLSLLSMGLLFLAQRIDRPPPDEPRDDGEGLTDKDKRKLYGAVTRMKLMKQIAGAGDLLITFIVGLLGFGGMLALLHRNSSGESIWTWVDQEFDPMWGWILGPAGWIVAALPILAVAAIRKSYSNEASRRKIGIIWDLATFWPRRFHPIAPPSYSERAVPELQQRLTEASEPGKCVVLAAHSQGTIVGYASMLQIDPARFERVTFATFGSPLGSYYQRFFPSYFDRTSYAALEEKLKANVDTEYSWRNFWRPTDPIGGCVFSEEEDMPNESTVARDRRLLDPWWWSRPLGQARPHVQVHSDYMDDPKLRNWILDAAANCPRGLRG